VNNEQGVGLAYIGWRLGGEGVAEGGQDAGGVGVTGQVPQRPISSGPRDPAGLGRQVGQGRRVPRHARSLASSARVSGPSIAKCP
jgi:hypothetical protein